MSQRATDPEPVVQRQPCSRLPTLPPRTHTPTHPYNTTHIHNITATPHSYYLHTRTRQTHVQGAPNGTKTSNVNMGLKPLSTTCSCSPPGQGFKKCTRIISTCSYNCTGMIMSIDYKLLVKSSDHPPTLCCSGIFFHFY